MTTKLIGFDVYFDSVDGNNVIVTFWGDGVQTIVKEVVKPTPVGFHECGNRRLATVPASAKLVSQYRTIENDS